MAERFIDIIGKISGDKETAALMKKAPKIYRGHIIAWLRKERDMFVGKKGKGGGTFRNKLMRKKIWGGRIGRWGGDTWSPQFSSLFRGKVSVGSSPVPDEIQLGMGHYYHVDKPVHRAVELLGRGGTVTSSREMIIPIYKNLNRLGIKPITGKSGDALKHYEMLSRGRKLFRIQFGNVARYFDEEMAKQGQYGRALMFIGVHKIRVKQYYNFEGDWIKREPKALKRADKAVDRATQKVNEGKI